MWLALLEESLHTSMDQEAKQMLRDSLPPSRSLVEAPSEVLVRPFSVAPGRRVCYGEEPAAVGDAAAPALSPALPAYLPHPSFTQSGACAGREQ